MVDKLALGRVVDSIGGLPACRIPTPSLYGEDRGEREPVWNA